VLSLALSTFSKLYSFDFQLGQVEMEARVLNGNFKFTHHPTALQPQPSMRLKCFGQVGQPFSKLSTTLYSNFWYVGFRPHTTAC
jgi:hypothetical protein